MRGRGTEPPAAIRAELGRVLDADAGIYRDASETTTTSFSAEKGEGA
ncbi:Uncharacterised protein [Mycobacteroides abscessus]|nr:Uncharacterised protein [Mycobacteroides abscessus]